MILLAVGLIATGAVLSFRWRSAGSDPVLTVRYRTDAPAATDVAHPWLEVINTSDRTVDLRDVTLRYHYTADGGAAYGANCVQTALRCSNITLKIAAAKTRAPKADHYLQIGFTGSAGSLEPGGTSQGIGLQLYRVDHRQMEQANDHSFNAEDTTYQESERVTAYLGGTHVWGEEPDGETPTAGKSPTAVPRTSASGHAGGEPPAGVLFDDFAYSGPGDPALTSHGWEVRESEGGPGIKGTWSSKAISFPAGEAGGSGQALRLEAGTDGTEEGTRQAEFHSSRPVFLTGTLVARVYLSDKPVSGKDGDHIAQSFFAISPDHESTKYSELDYEYLPNGGWGRYGPLLDTTSWRDAGRGDRVTRSRNQKFGGWHTLAVTAVGGTTTYSVDGQQVFTSGSRHFPRERMNIDVSSWFIDLPFKGSRSWEMKVDWLYYRSGEAMSAQDAEGAAAALAAGGTHYVNTLPTE
ncbi:cellulose binding domain-containing protein [Streptomyces actuosus]|uniref:cellulose binding domain-containing protein n=1 Tax=Streptomyces actuosus TaxID=1885 RepID=UPI0027DA0CFC|nr:cellulose binding domain-containing protein [Streptomyces actuosus]